MMFGYTVYLLEPNAMIAAAEMFLCLSAVVFQAKSLKAPNPLKLIFKYPLYSLAILQYLDFISSVLDLLSGRGHELNPLFFQWWVFPLKLVVAPGILIYIQPKWKGKPKILKFFINVILIIYLVVVVSNFLGAFNL